MESKKVLVKGVIALSSVLQSEEVEKGVIQTGGLILFSKCSDIMAETVICKQVPKITSACYSELEFWNREVVRIG